MTDTEYHEILVQIRIAVAVLNKELSIRVEETNKALSLQAVEYDRRLAMLNHEAAQLKAMQKTYVLRETYDLLVKEVAEIKSWIDKEKGTRSTIVVFSGIAVILSIITLLLNVMM